MNCPSCQSTHINKYGCTHYGKPRFHCQKDDGLLLIHGYGNVFEKYLEPGEVLDVEPGAWLWKEGASRM